MLDFSEKYKNLICSDISKAQLESLYESFNIDIPKKYKKEFIYTSKGFVNKYCLDY